jgi:ParB family transcriptional regulator, chromosome partitioning protein
MERARGLGRGLGALIGEQDAMRPREAIVEVPLEEIRPNRYQPRQSMDDTALHELAESIREHGVLQPVVVRRSGAAYELIAGERRFRAAQLAGLSRVPACIRDYSDQQALEIALVENLQREDIGPLEAARAYVRLRDEFGLTQEQIATRVGKSRSAVTNAMRLLQLPPRVQRSLESGEISEGHARALMQAEPARREAVLDRVVRAGASVREAEEMARGAAAPPAPASQEVVSGTMAPRPRLTDANMQAVEAKMRQVLGTKVQIRSRGGKGAITIEFYSDLDLERLLGLMNIRL